MSNFTINSYPAELEKTEALTKKHVVNGVTYYLPPDSVLHNPVDVIDNTLRIGFRYGIKQNPTFKLVESSEVGLDIVSSNDMVSVKKIAELTNGNATILDVESRALVVLGHEELCHPHRPISVNGVKLGLAYYCKKHEGLVNAVNDKVTQEVIEFLETDANKLLDFC